MTIFLSLKNHVNACCLAYSDRGEKERLNDFSTDISETEVHSQMWLTFSQQNKAFGRIFSALKNEIFFNLGSSNNLNNNIK